MRCTIDAERRVAISTNKYDAIKADSVPNRRRGDRINKGHFDPPSV
jgi:hypothetical protein